MLRKVLHVLGCLDLNLQALCEWRHLAASAGGGQRQLIGRGNANICHGNHRIQPPAREARAPAETEPREGEVARV